MRVRGVSWLESWFWEWLRASQDSCALYSRRVREMAVPLRRGSVMGRPSQLSSLPGLASHAHRGRVKPA